MDIKAKIIRTNRHKDYTLGTLFVNEETGKELCFVETLELPWKENKTGISCIPNGEYEVKKRTTQKFGLHFHIQNVPGRTWILIHPGNYTRQIQGCILPGLKHADIDGDGKIDIVHSKAALKKLLDVLPDSFILEIV